MPLARGAIARALMAFLPRRRLVPLIEEMLDDLRDIGLGNTVEEILARLRMVRKAGCAVAYGEVTPGVVGIAAPVFDSGQSPVAALCVTIAGHLVNGNTIDEISADVVRGAAELTCHLGEQRQLFDR